MIRDPSDGSVRDHEALKRQQEQMRECSPPTPENLDAGKIHLRPPDRQQQA
jgi:hypothetical protein